MENLSDESSDSTNRPGPSNYVPAKKRKRKLNEQQKARKKELRIRREAVIRKLQKRESRNPEIEAEQKKRRLELKKALDQLFSEKNTLTPQSSANEGAAELEQSAHSTTSRDPDPETKPVPEHQPESQGGDSVSSSAEGDGSDATLTASETGPDLQDDDQLRSFQGNKTGSTSGSEEE